jgi:16S rRNA processing protein RimM
MKNDSTVFRFNTGDDNSGSWVAIGKLLRCVGLDGWVRVGVMTDFPERFVSGAKYHFQKTSGALSPCGIEEVRDHFSADVLELKFVGHDHRDSISEFVGAHLVIPKDQREPLNDQTFYPDEIQGFVLLGPNQKKVGTVLKLEADVPCPYLVIDSDDYGEVLIPFRKVFFAEISKQKGLLMLENDLEMHVPVE